MDTVQRDGAVCPDHTALSRGGEVSSDTMSQFLQSLHIHVFLNLPFPASKWCILSMGFKKVLSDLTGRIQCNLYLVIFNDSTGLQGFMHTWDYYGDFSLRI